jgi:DNA-binding NarL/FixJ family response regulator
MTSDRMPDGMPDKAATIRILLVDDHTLFREGLRRLLDGEPGVRVCGDFESAEAAMAALASGLEFDVALLDYELTVASGHTTNGLDLLRQIRALRPGAKILFVTAGMHRSDLVTALKDLNAGIFMKTEPIAELMLAIQRTAKGERWVSSGAALAMLSNHQAQVDQEKQRHEHLNDRENLVLRGVLEGLTNKEIGAHLDLTESSVKAVLQKLFEKTGVRSRSQLVRYAIEAQIAPR